MSTGGFWSAIRASSSSRPAGERAEPVEMRLKTGKVICREVKAEQIAQTAVAGVEILSRAVRRDVIGAAARGILLHRLR
jgi:hypothetical protein